LYKVVRIYEDTHKKVKVLAAQSGKQMDEVIKMAVDQFELSNADKCCLCGKREAKDGCQYCSDCEKRYMEHGAQDARD